MAGLSIRPAETGDADALSRLLMPVVRAGETYAIDRDLAPGAALAHWTAPDRAVFVAEDAGAVVGTYYMRANQPGGGAHVCNCGFVTAAGAEGRGIARAMLDHALAEARARGYRGMQFNFVIETNTRAIALWQRAGFGIVGRLPGAFHHPTAGYVDALVMYRSLV